MNKKEMAWIKANEAKPAWARLYGKQAEMQMKIDCKYSLADKLKALQELKDMG